MNGYLLFHKIIANDTESPKCRKGTYTVGSKSNLAPRNGSFPLSTNPMVASNVQMSRHYLT